MEGKPDSDNSLPEQPLAVEQQTPLRILGLEVEQ